MKLILPRTIRRIGEMLYKLSNKLRTEHNIKDTDMFVHSLNALIDGEALVLDHTQITEDDIVQINTWMSCIIYCTDGICSKICSPTFDTFKTKLYDIINNFYLFVVVHKIDLTSVCTVSDKCRRVIPSCCKITTIPIDQNVHSKLKQALSPEIPSHITISPSFRVRTLADGTVALVGGVTSRLKTVMISLPAFKDDYWFEQRINHLITHPNKIPKNKYIKETILDKNINHFRAYLMLNTIAHEFCHVYQQSIGMIFNLDIPYRERLHEIEAVDFANKFVNELTLEDISWMNNVYKDLICQENRRLSETI